MGRHSKPAAFMFAAGQDCPVIAVALTSSRAGSVAAWAICARRVNDGRELVMTFDAITDDYRHRYDLQGMPTMRTSIFYLEYFAIAIATRIPMAAISKPDTAN